jgi:hypothetical protein
MQLKLLTHLTVVTTVLFFNAKISLAESIKVPYVSISGFKLRYTRRESRRLQEPT